MKYFTPELYLRFNSDDPREADEADHQWERAIGDYQKHLKQIADQLAPAARELAYKLDLHDADYLGLELLSVPNQETPLAVLAVRPRPDQLLRLVYGLTEEPLIQQVAPPWPYSKEKVHWLYDEFSVDARGAQQHEILLSHGRLVSLKFQDLHIFRHQTSAVAVA
jgi:hypothetical protein